MQRPGTWLALLIVASWHQPGLQDKGGQWDSAIAPLLTGQMFTQGCNQLLAAFSTRR